MASIDNNKVLPNNGGGVLFFADTLQQQAQAIETLYKNLKEVEEGLEWMRTRSHAATNKPSKPTAQKTFAVLRTDLKLAKREYDKVYAILKPEDNQAAKFPQENDQDAESPQGSVPTIKKPSFQERVQAAKSLSDQLSAQVCLIRPNTTLSDLVSAEVSKKKDVVCAAAKCVVESLDTILECEKILGSKAFSKEQQDAPVRGGATGPTLPQLLEAGFEMYFLPKADSDDSNKTFSDEDDGSEAFNYDKDDSGKTFHDYDDNSYTFHYDDEDTQEKPLGTTKQSAHAELSMSDIWWLISKAQEAAAAGDTTDANSKYAQAADGLATKKMFNFAKEMLIEAGNSKEEADWFAELMKEMLIEDGNSKEEADLIVEQSVVPLSEDDLNNLIIKADADECAGRVEEAEAEYEQLADQFMLLKRVDSAAEMCVNAGADPEDAFAWAGLHKPHEAAADIYGALPMPPEPEVKERVHASEARGEDAYEAHKALKALITDVASLADSFDNDGVRAVANAGVESLILEVADASREIDEYYKEHPEETSHRVESRLYLLKQAAEEFAAKKAALAAELERTQQDADALPTPPEPGPEVKERVPAPEGGKAKEAYKELKALIADVASLADSLENDAARTCAKIDIEILGHEVTDALKEIDGYYDEHPDKRSHRVESRLYVLKQAAEEFAAKKAAITAALEGANQQDAAQDAENSGKSAAELKKLAKDAENSGDLDTAHDLRVQAAEVCVNKRSLDRAGDLYAKAGEKDKAYECYRKAADDHADKGAANKAIKMRFKALAVMKSKRSDSAGGNAPDVTAPLPQPESGPKSDAKPEEQTTSPAGEAAPSGRTEPHIPLSVLPPSPASGGGPAPSHTPTPAPIAASAHDDASDAVSPIWELTLQAKEALKSIRPTPSTYDFKAAARAHELFDRLGDARMDKGYFFLAAKAYGTAIGCSAGPTSEETKLICAKRAAAYSAAAEKAAEHGSYRRAALLYEEAYDRSKAMEMYLKAAEDYGAKEAAAEDPDTKETMHREAKNMRDRADIKKEILEHGISNSIKSSGPSDVNDNEGAEEQQSRSQRWKDWLGAESRHERSEAAKAWWNERRQHTRVWNTEQSRKRQVWLDERHQHFKVWSDKQSRKRQIWLDERHQHMWIWRLDQSQKWHERRQHMQDWRAEQHQKCYERSETAKDWLNENYLQLLNWCDEQSTKHPERSDAGKAAKAWWNERRQHMQAWNASVKLKSADWKVCTEVKDIVDTTHKYAKPIYMRPLRQAYNRLPAPVPAEMKEVSDWLGRTPRTRDRIRGAPHLLKGLLSETYSTVKEQGKEQYKRLLTHMRVAHAVPADSEVVIKPHRVREMFAPIAKPLNDWHARQSQKMLKKAHAKRNRRIHEKLPKYVNEFLADQAKEREKEMRRDIRKIIKSQQGDTKVGLFAKRAEERLHLTPLVGFVELKRDQRQYARTLKQNRKDAQALSRSKSNARQLIKDVHRELLMKEVLAGNVPPAVKTDDEILESGDMDAILVGYELNKDGAAIPDKDETATEDMIAASRTAAEVISNALNERSETLDRMVDRFGNKVSHKFHRLAMKNGRLDALEDVPAAMDRLSDRVLSDPGMSAENKRIATSVMTMAKQTVLPKMQISQIKTRADALRLKNELADDLDSVREELRRQSAEATEALRSKLRVDGDAKKTVGRKIVDACGKLGEKIEGTVRKEVSDKVYKKIEGVMHRKMPEQKEGLQEALDVIGAHGAVWGSKMDALDSEDPRIVVVPKYLRELNLLVESAQSLLRMPERYVSSKDLELMTSALNAYVELVGMTLGAKRLSEYDIDRWALEKKTAVAAEAAIHDDAIAKAIEQYKDEEARKKFKDEAQDAAVKLRQIVQKELDTIEVLKVSWDILAPKISDENEKTAAQNMLQWVAESAKEAKKLIRSPEGTVSAKDLGSVFDALQAPAEALNAIFSKVVKTPEDLDAEEAALNRLLGGPAES